MEKPEEVEGTFQPLGTKSDAELRAQVAREHAAQDIITFQKNLTFQLGQQHCQQTAKGMHISAMDIQQDFPPIIPLNVGGHRFITRLSTLQKYEDSMLAVMFSGRHKVDCDKDGNYFIDSNGTYFGFILDYLRHESLPPDSMALAVYKEARYYNITSLIHRLEISPAVARMLVKEDFRKQFPDYDLVKQRIIRAAMEKAANDKIGEVLVHAFRKEFVPKAPYFNVNHECIASEAQVTVGPWESPAEEESLIKALESDFMQEGYNIKCHDQKRKCRYYNGQNCQKCVYKLTFLFL